MAYKANGSTFTFGSQVSKVRKIGRKVDGALIDVTDLGDTENEYEVGTTDSEITIEVIGSSSIDVGEIGTASIVWNDGTTRTLGDLVCSSSDENGELNGEITTSLSFKKSAVAA